MDDVISRQAAIDAIEREQSLVERPITETRWFDLGLRKAQEVLSGLPTAQPEQQWIPCSERLPEEDKDVLISYRYKDGEGDTSHAYIEITSYGKVCFGGRQIHELKEWRQPFEFFHANYEVVAWMPLPKPYKVD